MGEKSNQIASDIERTRAELGTHLQELEYKVKGMTDWRLQFQKRPMMMIGLALGGGVLLAMMLPGRHAHTTNQSRFCAENMARV